MADKEASTGHQALRLICPHCNSHVRIRHSRTLSPIYRDGIVECKNIISCGWRGRFGLEFIANLTPSAKPADGINLPNSPYVLPSSPYALPVTLRTKTKNPFDPNRNQLPLFGKEKSEHRYEH